MALPRCGALSRSLTSPSSLPAVLLTGLKRCSSLASAVSNGQGRESELIPWALQTTDFPTSFSRLKQGHAKAVSARQFLVSPVSLNVCLSTSLDSLSLLPLIQEKEYKCPSSLPENFSQMVILDNETVVKSFYDCPVSSSTVDLVKAPNVRKSEILEGPGKISPAKETTSIMRIRHKKMKKHKLKKLRKRMYFLWRKQKLARRAKRMAIYWKEIEGIKKTGEDFDAESFIREQLAKARKGGYYRNVFESNVR